MPPKTVMRARVHASRRYPGTFYALIEVILPSGTSYHRRGSGHHCPTPEFALARAEVHIAAHRQAGTVPAPYRTRRRNP